MIHIVFNEPDVEVLQSAMGLDASLQGQIMVVRDDYAVGPLLELNEPEGWQRRRQWWLQIFQAAGESNPEEILAMVDDKMQVHQLLQTLEQNHDEQVWIWAAQNKHDVCGYYWLVKQLQPWQGRVFILYLNNLPFINQKGSIFFPQWLSEIQPREMLKAKKLARPITPSEFEVDGDEWLRLCRENAGVRLLEGGKKITGAPENHYDSALSRYVTGDFSKGSRIVSQFISREKEKTGDLFLLARLANLLSQTGWETKGEADKSIRELEIRNPQLPSLKKKIPHGADQQNTPTT
jgi:hypothetical protein